MLPPDEVMTEAFLPAVRTLVSIRLRSQGFSQARIAGMLGVTQASVSLYVSSGGERAYRALESMAVARDSADRFAALLAEDAKRSVADSVGTLQTIWSEMLGRGNVCEVHRRMYPELAGCDVCLRLYKPRPEDGEALREVSRAVAILEGSMAFARVMPEVSVNLAYLAGGGKSVEDVVAIPGRIVKVRGIAKAMQPPEFGASRHMAQVLLLARTRLPEARAAINLRYDGRMNKTLRSMSLKTTEVGGTYPPGPADPVVGALAAKLRASSGPFDAVVDRGGRGLEPNVYLFGPDAVGLARLAVRIAEAYSAR